MSVYKLGVYKVRYMSVIIEWDVILFLSKTVYSLERIIN